MRGGHAALGVLRVLVLLLALRAAEIVLGLSPPAIASRIDLFVLYVVFRSARSGVVDGVLIGLAVGLFRDVVSLQAVGTDLLPLAAAGAFSAWSHRKLVGESVLGLFLILAGGVVAHDLTAGLRFIADGGSAFLTRLALDTLPAGLLTAGIGVLASEVLRAGRRRRPREAAA
ncbi:MAG: hypothetical protein ABIH26_10825 [Candidatus Eisenbacteria bacterium]